MSCMSPFSRCPDDPHCWCDNKGLSRARIWPVLVQLLAEVDRVGVGEALALCHLLTARVATFILFF